MSATTGERAAAGFRPLTEVIEALAPEPYLELLEERFGIPATAFSELVIFRPNSRCLAIADRRLEVPAGLEPLAYGMPFLYVNLRHPRLTTAAAIRFGPLATRNVVDLDAREVADFVSRRDVVLDDEQAARVTGSGYVIARHRGMVVGMGHARAGERGLVLVGNVPRSWPARLG